MNEENQAVREILGANNDVSAMQAAREARDLIGELVSALIWCSGSADFSPEGQAGAGWLTMQPKLDKALAWLKKVTTRPKPLLVVIESPYAGDVSTNVRYAKACMADSLKRGESPYASHLFFAAMGILVVEDPRERQQGMEAGFAWGERAECVAVYIDRGISGGMKEGVARATERKQVIVFRSIESDIPASHYDMWMRRCA